MARPKGAVPVAALEKDLGYLMRRASQLIDAIRLQEVGASGLTARQYAFLAALEQHQRASQTELVRLTSSDRSTTAELAARLSAKGLVARERSDLDARAMTVVLTPRGREILRDTKLRMRKAERRLRKFLPNDEGQRLVSLLQRFVAEAEPQAPPKRRPSSRRRLKGEQA